MKINKQIQIDHETKKKLSKKENLEKDMEYKEIENRNRYEALLEARKDMERMNEDKISMMIQSHQIELERRR